MPGKRSIVLTLLALCLLLPASAVGADEEFEGVATVFRLKASNGYRLLALASSNRADGRGQLVIFVGGKKSSASYFTKATVTEAGIEADLGELGQIDVDYVPTGGRERVHSPCGRTVFHDE